ncbi:unnamed protein product [Fraxinus pennsylvanica]|uniref:Uncharacterized protein n=1 Tax=Fraxinus pennsylvanica TaxID=56036 RepID=A0AAD1ZP80_9LAMI|nr:unnamed protein product [Fraxinus pennsylvanica]
MEEALELTRTKDTKERMMDVERLHQLLDAWRKSLTSSEVTSLVDACLDILKDNNFRVSQGALQALASAAVLSGEHFKLGLALAKAISFSAFSLRLRRLVGFFNTLKRGRWTTRFGVSN